MIEHVWIVTDVEDDANTFVSAHRTLDGAKRSRDHIDTTSHVWTPTEEPDQYTLHCEHTEVGFNITRWPLER